ncbi:MAG: hypothetical protein WC955_03820 [Elusimicrobiota bacterium]
MKSGSRNKKSIIDLQFYGSAVIALMIVVTLVSSVYCQEVSDKIIIQSHTQPIMSQDQKIKRTSDCILKPYLKYFDIGLYYGLTYGIDYLLALEDRSETKFGWNTGIESDFTILDKMKLCFDIGHTKRYFIMKNYLTVYSFYPTIESEYTTTYLSLKYSFIKTTSFDCYNGLGFGYFYIKDTPTSTLPLGGGEEYYLPQTTYEKYGWQVLVGLQYTIAPLFILRTDFKVRGLIDGRIQPYLLACLSINYILLK